MEEHVAIFVTILCLYSVFEDKNFFIYNNPYGFNVDSKVIVNQDVAKPRNFIPFNFFMSDFEFVRKSLG